MNMSVLWQGYYLTRTVYQAYVHLCSASFKLSGTVDNTTQEAMCGPSSSSLTLSHLRAALEIFQKRNGVSILNYELQKLAIGDIMHSVCVWNHELSKTWVTL